MIDQQPLITEFTWRRSDGQVVNLSCRFSLNGVRHVVERHFRSEYEHWGRVLPRSLVDRLARLADSGSGWAPSAEDFAAFVEGVVVQVHASCRRPLLCEFHERALAIALRGRRRPIHDAAPIAKVMFVLQSGAIVIVTIDDEAGVALESGGVALKGRLTTCFFPSGRDWVAPRRAYTQAVRRFVMTWSPHRHRSGHPKLPGPLESRRSRDGRLDVERLRFRFVTPETWGFRAAEDGTLVFRGDVPAWK